MDETFMDLPFFKSFLKGLDQYLVLDGAYRLVALDEVWFYLQILICIPYKHLRYSMEYISFASKITKRFKIIH